VATRSLAASGLGGDRVEDGLDGYGLDGYGIGARCGVSGAGRCNRVGAGREIGAHGGAGGCLIGLLGGLRNRGGGLRVGLRGLRAGRGRLGLLLLGLDLLCLLLAGQVLVQDLLLGGLGLLLLLGEGLGRGGGWGLGGGGRSGGRGRRGVLSGGRILGLQAVGRAGGGGGVVVAGGGRLGAGGRGGVAGCGCLGQAGELGRGWPGWRCGGLAGGGGRVE